jgi:hypothetical protein
MVHKNVSPTKVVRSRFMSRQPVTFFTWPTGHDFIVANRSRFFRRQPVTIFSSPTGHDFFVANRSRFFRRQPRSRFFRVQPNNISIRRSPRCRQIRGHDFFAANRPARSRFFRRQPILKGTENHVANRLRNGRVFLLANHFLVMLHTEYTCILYKNV